MKALSYILLFCFAFSKVAIAQYCTSNDRFTELDFFQANEISSLQNVTFATDVTDGLGNTQDLDMDIYFPSAASENLTERPFILLLHGGGFQSGNKSLMTNYCTQLAQKGFVAATMDYRKGWNTSIPTDQVKAGYRVQQDANAALRFIVENANVVDIDTSWIFIGGQSAGAIASFFTSYTDQQEWELEFPGIEAELGSLNTSGNNITHSFSLKGIFNNWGMALSTSIDTPDLLPTISFHGGQDSTVPIDSSMVNSIEFIGSGIVHNVLETNAVCSEITIDSLGGHGIYTNSAGLQFRIERASCFFKSIFCDNCATTLMTQEFSANCSMDSLTSHIEATQNSIELFPNPTQNEFTVTGDLQNYQIEILNASGTLLQTVNSTNTSHTIDISELPQGLFFIKLSNLTNNNLVLQQIIKMN